jgi:solute carrier family 34 (sodium-dependent phosphate cotransporter)
MENAASNPTSSRPEVHPLHQMLLQQNSGAERSRTSSDNHQPEPPVAAESVAQAEQPDAASSSQAEDTSTTSVVENPIRSAPPPLLSSSQQLARDVRASSDGLSIQDAHNPITPFSSLEDAPADTELSIQAPSPEPSVLGADLDSDESTDLIPNPNQPIHPVLRPELQRPAWQKGLLYASSGTFLCSYLLNLSLIGVGFKLLEGKYSNNMFDEVGNPFSAMMVGIVGTTLLQSSSASTSIIIALAGSGMLSVDSAVMMIMGANVASTAIKTLLSLDYFRDRNKYAKGFASATTNDILNLLTILILLPIQWSTKFLSAMTFEMAKHRTPPHSTEYTWHEPIKKLIYLVTDFIAQYDHQIADDITKGICSPSSLETPCPRPLLNGGKLFEAGLPDNTAGAICISLGTPLACLSLFLLVKSLRKLFRSKVKKTLRNSANIGPNISMLSSCAMTILTQSSSTTTSIIAPLCATDEISLKQTLPLILGANVGTTVTGLLAAAVASSNPTEALQVALAHIFYNVLQVLMWYPNEKISNIPLDCAKKLGDIAGNHKTMPFLYTAGAFVGLPAACYGISLAAS